MKIDSELFVNTKECFDCLQNFFYERAEYPDFSFGEKCTILFNVISLFSVDDIDEEEVRDCGREFMMALMSKNAIKETIENLYKNKREK